MFIYFVPMWFVDLFWLIDGDWLIDGLIDGLIDWLIDGLIDWLIDWLIAGEADPIPAGGQWPRERDLHPHPGPHPDEDDHADQQRRWGGSPAPPLRPRRPPRPGDRRGRRHQGQADQAAGREDQHQDAGQQESSFFLVDWMIIFIFGLIGSMTTCPSLKQRPEINKIKPSFVE